ncbi:hypothetical protein [Halalkalicoccus salilacus]|uniref:hypothetical protein n=1 Tax=Halalkalicoccus salilacus TaxID=3117459 RepID=UPI00300EB305
MGVLINREGAPEGDGSEDGRDDEEETNTLTVNLANDDVGGVEITVQRTGGPDVESETTSKASAGGQASFELEPGHYYADAEGYVGTLTAINVTEGDVEITLQNESGATVRVKVTDAETGEPIEGATIEGVCNLHYSGGDSYITGETGENGVAMAQAGVTPTACDTRVSAEGYEDANVRVHVPDDELTVELVPEDAAGGDSGDETDDDATDGSSDTKDKKTEKDSNCP